MTNITIYCSNNDYVGFRVSGHSGYSEAGYDIVCAGISALTINCMNSIEELTEERFSVFQHEDDGVIDYMLDDKPGIEAEILLKSLVLGLRDLEKEYKDFISLDYKEV